MTSPPDAGSEREELLLALAQAPGASLSGIWLRRLAAAWAASRNANAPEVLHAATELVRVTKWVSLEEEIRVLTSILAMPEVFEVSLPPVDHLSSKRLDPGGGYRAALHAAEEQRLPPLLALYRKLGPQGRRNILWGLDSEESTAALFSISQQDGICPAILDDRDLELRAWRSPASEPCALPELPADELQNLDRLSRELTGPWPRAVRAIGALRAMRDRARAKWRPSPEQQLRFVEACLVQPMCPLWLLDELHPTALAALEEASSKAPAEKRAKLDAALKGIQNRSPSSQQKEQVIEACIHDVVAALRGTAHEPWILDARASRFRSACRAGMQELSREALERLLPHADTETAGDLVAALIEKRGKLPADLGSKLAEDPRTRIVLYGALSAARRAREMPDAWAKRELLLESGAVAVVRDHLGTVPDTFEHLPPTRVRYEGKMVEVAYVRVQAKGEYANVPAFDVALGPFAPGKLYAGEEEFSGTLWGTQAGDLRTWVETHMNDPRSLSIFTHWQ